jgi:hypothetical protein
LAHNTFPANEMQTLSFSLIQFATASSPLGVVNRNGIIKLIQLKING